MKTSDQVIAVWGVGEIFEEYYPQIARDIKVSFLVDNDPEKWGKRYTEDGIECIPPGELRGSGVEMAYVAIYDGKACASVQKQLRELGIAVRHIYEVAAEINYKKEREFLEGTGYLTRSVYKRKPEERLVKFFDFTLNSAICNFNCDYCYLKQNPRGGSPKFPFWRRKMPHSPQYIAYAVRRERMNGSCIFCVAGTGETLLIDGIAELIYELLKDGHVVRLVTNGVMTDKINEILRLPDELLSSLIVSFSVHYLELIKHKRMEAFLNNIERVRDSAASLLTSIVASDVYVPHIDEIKQVFWDRLGVYPDVDPARNDSDLLNPYIMTELPRETYEKIWGCFGSERFKFRCHEGLKRPQQCMAGTNILCVDVYSGNLLKCTRAPKEKLRNLYCNLDEDIAASPLGECPAAFCYNGAFFSSLRTIKDVEVLPFGDMFQRTDKWGRKYIKEPLFTLLNRGIE